MPQQKVSRSPRVTVIFDSNVLYTEHVDRLICKEAHDYCAGESKSLGLEIDWRLPEIVISERKNQMAAKAATLSESVRKLERLVGHNWGLTAETLDLHISASIDRQMSELGMNALSLDFSLVDWSNLVDAAARRVPPFSREKEKGFKDAIILESFVQCASKSPRSPAAARIFLITEDALLRQAAQERVKIFKNVSVVTSIDDLRTEINAVAAHLPKEFIDRYVKKADALFFVVSEKKGLMYDWEVLGKIKERFDDVLSSVPEEGYKVRTKINSVSTPTFIKKEGQKLVFQSKIARKMIATSPAAVVGNGDAAVGSRSGLLSVGEAYQPEKSEMEGQHVFQVIWSLTLNKAGRLISPHFIDLVYSSSTWDVS